MRVENGERDRAILGNNGDGGANDDVEIVGSDTFTDTIEEDSGTGRHRRRNANSDDLFQTASRHFDILWGEGERANSGGERLGLEDNGRQRRRSGDGGSGGANGGERRAEPAGRVVVANLRTAEVKVGTGSSVEVIAHNETHAKTINHSGILERERPVRQMELKVDTSGDQGGPADTTESVVANTMGKPLVANHRDTVGMIGEEEVSQLTADEGQRAAGVRAICCDPRNPLARAKLKIEKAGGAE